MPTRYEQEIEEIMRRQRDSAARREGQGAGPGPGAGQGQGPIPFPGAAPARRAPSLSVPLFGRMFRTLPEVLVGLGIVLGLSSYFLRLVPSMGPVSLAMIAAWVALALFWIGIIGPAFGLLKPRPQRYWRDRPVDIGNAPGSDLRRRLGYTWWRLRVNVGRIFRR